jgi:hypothetical protein
MQEQLASSDTSSIIQGWRLNGLRPRLEDLIENHLDRIVQNVPKVRALIHGDFSTFHTIAQTYHGLDR